MEKSTFVSLRTTHSVTQINLRKSNVVVHRPAHKMTRRYMRLLSEGESKRWLLSKTFPSERDTSSDAKQPNKKTKGRKEANQEDGRRRRRRRRKRSARLELFPPPRQKVTTTTLTRRLLTEQLLLTRNSPPPKTSRPLPFLALLHHP